MYNISILKEDRMIKAAILGATGYAGCELVRLLISHKDVELVYLASHSYEGRKFSEVYPMYQGHCDLTLMSDDLAAASDAADVVFMALPAGIASASVTEDMLKKTCIIDLGADFRLHDAGVYEKWYRMEHGNKELLKKAVYGFPEIHRDSIRGKRLIANPGCYTTASILALYPLVRHHLVDTSTIIIDAASGTSGAGRGNKTSSLFCEVNESFKAYGVSTHRHTPEIEQELSIAAGSDIVLQFTPHLVPMNRGILATCYAKYVKGVSDEDIKAAYDECYAGEYFIRLVSSMPETRNVRGSNFADIWYRRDERTGNIIVLSAIDNLMKGAAGQAVQNMNIITGLDEKCALEHLPSCTM